MLKRILLTCAALPVLAGSAFAADLTPPPDYGWQFTFAPYLWASRITGDVGIGDRTADVDVSFKDILEHLDFAFMSAGEARNGRFSLSADVMYSALSSSDDTPHGIIANKIDSNLSEWIVTGVAGYSLLYDDRYNLDVVAGARYWSANTKLKVKGGLLDGSSASDTVNWTDPMIGVKGKAYISDQFFVLGWGLIGGFGVGAKSDWDVMGGVGYDFSDRFSTVLSYRALGINYEQGKGELNLVYSGPLLGVVFKF